MARTRNIALALVALGLVFWVVRSRSSDAKDAADPAAESTAQGGEHSRAHDDVNTLARALSLVAGQTIGLVRVQGRVLDQSSGAPISGAEVFFVGPSGESSAHCDAQGRFDLEILPGFYRSYAQANGFVAVAPAAAERVPQQNLSEAIAMPRAKIAPLVGLFGHHRGVQLFLSAGATLQVSVVDEAGTAISGVVVAAQSARRTQLLSGADVGETDSAGVAHLRVPTGPLWLRAQHDDYAGSASATRLRLQAGEAAHATIVLQRGCIIEGSVVHDDGRPALEGALERQLAPDRYAPAAKIEAGKIRYNQLHEGTVALRAWPWKNPPSDTKVYECTEGAVFRNEVFHIPKAQPILRGRVTDQAGTPVPFAFVDVFALQPGSPGQQERADEDGEFAFFELRPGPYQVSVYEAGRGALMQLIDAPSTGVPLQLGGTGALFGKVQWLERGALTMEYSCDFSLANADGAMSDAVSMPLQRSMVLVEGHNFRIEGVAACPIRGHLRSGDRFESFQVRVHADSDTQLLFE